MQLQLDRSFASAVFIMIVAHVLLLQPLSVHSHSCGLTSELVTIPPTPDYSLRGSPLLAQRFEITPLEGIVVTSVAIAMRGQQGQLGLYTDQESGGQFYPGAPVSGQAQLTPISLVPITGVATSSIATYATDSLSMPKGFYWLRYYSGNSSSLNWHTSSSSAPSSGQTVIAGISSYGVGNDTTYFSTPFSFTVYGCTPSLVSTVNTTASTPQLTFNLTAPTVQIAPKGDSGSVVNSASVAINMARLSEISGFTVVRSAVNITENGMNVCSHLTWLPDRPLDSTHTDIQAGGVVEYQVDVVQSQLVLSFARFESSLVYDPDLGVLLGSKRDDGVSSGSDTTLWIIAVAVVVPVAVVFVVAVIVAGTLVGYQKHRRNKRHLAKLRSATVNFDSGDHRDEV